MIFLKCWLSKSNERSIKGIFNLKFQRMKKKFVVLLLENFKHLVVLVNGILNWMDDIANLGKEAFSVVIDRKNYLIDMLF